MAIEKLVFSFFSMKAEAEGRLPILIAGVLSAVAIVALTIIGCVWALR